MKTILFSFLWVFLVIPSIAFSQSAVDYFNRGVNAYEAQDYRGAIKNLNRCVKLNPNNAEAYKVMGNAKLKLFNSDARGAILAYTKAIEIDPNFAKAYRNRGAVKSSLNDYVGAIEDFSKAIEADPSYALAYRDRAKAKEQEGNFEGAKIDIKAAEALELAEQQAVNEPSEIAKIDSVELILDGEVKPVISKSTMVDLTAFAPAQSDINFAGKQLLNARRTFVVGLVLNLAGGLLLAGTALTPNAKAKTGLAIAGTISSAVGGVVMLTAVIPIGGAGKILQQVKFPTKVHVDVN